MTTTPDKVQAKRPLGLKNDSKNKKMKKDLNQKEQEITIEIKSENQNDFEELKMVYESALDGLSKTRLEIGEKVAKEENCKMLFRGVVHECDKMIRIRQENPKESVPQATDDELALLLERVKDCLVLPAEFHLIYANALYYLSLLEKDGDQSIAGFLDESIYRIGVALKMDPNSTAIHCSYVRSIMQKVLIMGGQQDSELIGIIQQEMDTVFSSSLFSNDILETALEVSHLYTSLIDLQTVLETKIEWTEKAVKYWTLLVGDNKLNTKAIIGLASCWLNIADISIEYLEENPTSTAIGADRIQTFLENAISELQNVKANFSESASSAPSTSSSKISMPVDEPYIQSQILLGECHVHMGNLLDTDTDENNQENEESLEHYRQAVQIFQNVQKIQPGALPDQFEDFLSEWLLDMN